MVKTILKQEAQRPEDASWTSVSDSLHVCGFDCGLEGAVLPEAGSLGYEILFCQNGAMQIRMADGGSLWLRKREVLLVSAASQAQSLHFSGGRFQGVLVAVDVPATEDGLAELCGLLGGLRLDMSQVAALMETRRGLAHIGGQAWSESVFSALAGIPAGERERYCALKAVELLYLLCCGGLRLSQMPSVYYQDRYQRDAIQQVNAYIHGHLAENLSIENLARRFRISPTVLKTCFCQTYGKPLHRYISTCRMERAAELLNTTALPVIQIASEVGYSSVSQFGAVFKQKYYLTPAQYRRREKKV